MATFEEAEAASATSERMALELQHLLALLDADVTWQARHTLPEPLRTQLLSAEAGFESLRQGIDMHLRGRELFKEGAARLRPQFDMGMLPTHEMEESWAMTVRGTELAAEGFIPGADALRSVISALRAQRNELPLDGSETPLN